MVDLECAVVVDDFFTRDHNLIYCICAVGHSFFATRPPRPPRPAVAESPFLPDFLAVA